MHSYNYHLFLLRFPAKENIRAKWLNFINENGLNTNDITKNSLICSAHFDLASFTCNANQNMRILKKTAVPTCIVERVKNISFGFIA